MSEQQIQKPVEAEDLIQQNTLPLLTANQKKHLRKKNKKKKEKENKLMEQEKDEIPVQLFVFNLENYVSEDTIKHRFQECGIVESVYIPLSCSHNAGFSAQYALPFSHNRGFAFVTMKNQHDTQAALDTLNNSNLFGKQMKIQIINDCSDFVSVEDSNQTEILCILQSESYSEDQKIEKLEQIYTNLKTMNKYKLSIVYDNQIFADISERLNECQSSLEKILLDIILIITKKCSEIPLISIGYNSNQASIIYDQMQQSQLIDKIETRLRKIETKIDIIKEFSFNYTAQQLVQVYLFIMFGQKINKDIFKICVQIIEKSINYIVDDIKNIDVEQIEKNNEFDQQQCVKLQSLINTIKALKKINRYQNRNYLIQDLKIHEILSSLIHFQCPVQLNCPIRLCINQSLQSSQLLQVLAKYAYDIIGYLIYQDKTVKNYLIQNHNFLHHISSIIISFATVDQQQLQQITNENQIICFYNSSLIISILDVIDKIPVYDKDNCKALANIFSLIPNLIKLNNWNFDHYQFNDDEKQTSKIRNYSRWCLANIQCYGDEEEQMKLTEAGYACSLILAKSTYSGYGESDQFSIIDVFEQISDFFKVLYQGQEYQIDPREQRLLRLYQAPIFSGVKHLTKNVSNMFFHKHVFPPQLILAKKSLEQIEEEGGEEEIEAQVFNKRNENNAMNKAISTKQAILNIKYKKKLDYY